MVDNLEQCVTPLQKVPIYVAPNGISTIPDGTLFGIADGDVSLLNYKGEIFLTKEGIGSRYALLLDNGKALLAESYNKEESWKSTIIKFDSEGNILWERQTGLIGLDGLAVTPDGSFIAVGATDEEYNGHLMLFDHDGNKLWDNHINGRSGGVTVSKTDRISGRIETVAVSKSGYVAAGPRDQYIYLYNRFGELIFTYHANSYYSAQDTAIAPDETYFLFGSERTYLNCYTLHGELLWQKEVGPICTIKISQDSECIAGGTGNGGLFLLDRNGHQLWSKKASFTFVDKITISGDGEYIAANTEEGPFSFVSAFEVYNNQGELLWQYESEHPFKALAISDDGHYLAASNGFSFFIFDNFQVIEEYASSECAHNDNTESDAEPAEFNIFISLSKVLVGALVALFIVYYFLKRKKGT
jgi:outer membrane protein assembly factor BamB